MEIILYKEAGVRIGERREGKVVWKEEREDGGAGLMICSGLVVGVQRGKEWVKVQMRVKGGRVRGWGWDGIEVLAKASAVMERVREGTVLVVSGKPRVDKEGRVTQVLVGNFGTCEVWGERGWGAGADEKEGGWQWTDGDGEADTEADFNIKAETEKVSTYERGFASEGEDEGGLFTEEENGEIL